LVKHEHHANEAEFSGWHCSGSGFRQAYLLPQCVIFWFPVFSDCEFRAIRQVRFEVVNIAAETDIPAFFREVVLRFQPEQVFDKHGRSLDRLVRSSAHGVKDSALDWFRVLSADIKVPLIKMVRQ
jgi:hypothetical protein